MLVSYTYIVTQSLHILQLSGYSRRNMDESWRIPAGISATIARRKSTEDSSQRIFHPEDFNDVFGGPPRSVLSRQFSGGELNSSEFFYQDIFRKPERFGPAKSGRNLPEFRIPAGGRAVGRRNEEFNVDLFGVDFEEIRRSRSRSKSKTNSKSNSSSVLSSEDFSPVRPGMSEDDILFPVYPSKLRPINIPSKWNTPTTTMHEVQQRHQDMPDYAYSRPSLVEKQFVDNEQIENFQSTHFGFSRRASSPESMSRGAYSYSSVKVSVADLEPNSPSSVVSSLGHKLEAGARKCEAEASEEDEEDEDEDEDEGETMRSYVIEINSNRREETDEGLGVDEAIAWAKESFHSHSSPEEWSMRQHKKESSADVTERSAVHQFPDGHSDGCESLHLRGDENPNTLTTEEQRKMDECKEMELLEEDIKLWSSGKDRNIKLLLSTLHDILWPNSGWHPIFLANLNESSHVKKAYQKARLCLHPDKLQQRGATLLQKYVAEKAFPILQEAWAAYISQDIHHFS